MADLTVAQIVEAGLTVALVSAAVGGDEFVNEKSDVFLMLTNADASSTTVTFATTLTSTVVPGFGTVTRSSIAVAVAASATMMIGPFADVFNDTNGKVQITYSSVVSLTVQAIKLEAAR